MGNRIVLPSQERLREFFHYDPETGFCTAMADRNTRRAPMKRGDRFHTYDGQGYLKMMVDGKSYFQHRLIWKWMTGNEPPAQLDHANQKKDDNRWCNLREATPAQNNANRGVSRVNTTGRKGVAFHPSARKWTATIQIAGVTEFLGLFDTTEEAAAAYEARAKAHYGDFYDASTGPQKVFYDVVHLVDEPFLDTVAETMRRLWAYKLRPDVPDALKAELDALGLGLSQKLAVIDSKRLGHLRTR